MAKKKKVNDYGTGIPQHEMEALARVLLPEIEKFYASEEGQRQFAQWKAGCFKLCVNLLSGVE